MSISNGSGYDIPFYYPDIPYLLGYVHIHGPYLLCRDLVYDDDLTKSFRSTTHLRINASIAAE